MRCPNCGNRDDLSLIEVHEEYGTTDPGRINRDRNGHLIAPTKFFFSPGNSILVEIQCYGCGHQWKPRQQLVSSESASDPSGGA